MDIMKLKNSLPGINRIFGNKVVKKAAELLYRPKINIKEKDKKVEIEVDVPGFSKEDFSLSVNENILIIEVENQNEVKVDGNDYVRREFSYNSFKEHFELPDYVKTDEINANYKDGILKIVLPKDKNRIKDIKKISVE